MNILVLADVYLPHAGGSRIMYHNFYKRITEQFPVKVTVLTTKIPGWREFDSTHSTSAYRIVRNFRPLRNSKYYNVPKMALPLAQALRMVSRERFDMIHCGDLWPPGLIALALNRWLRIPFLAYSHGDDFTLSDQYRYQPMVRNHIYRRADGVVAANGFAQQKLSQIGIPDSRVCKVLPGVDCERLRPAPRSERLVRELSLEGKTVLLTVARLVPKKGHDLVLQALSKIAPNFPSIHYLIAGEGSERENLERLAGQLGLNSMVTFLGDIPNECLPEIYNLADLFVMANRQPKDGDVESFGIVFIEASAAGKPIVGARSGGVAEAVVDGVTGILVPPDDVDALAASITDLLRNPSLRAQLGDAGMRRARQDFSWAARAALLYSFSERILQEQDSGVRRKAIRQPT